MCWLLILDGSLSQPTIFLRCLVVYLDLQRIDFLFFQMKYRRIIVCIFWSFLLYSSESVILGGKNILDIWWSTMINIFWNSMIFSSKNKKGRLKDNKNYCKIKLEKLLWSSNSWSNLEWFDITFSKMGFLVEFIFFWLSSEPDYPKLDQLKLKMHL